MPKELARKSVPVRRGFAPYNTMAFPRELRAAIPDLHGGRILKLDSINGRASNTPLFGPQVELKLVVTETGKLTGQFVVRMGLKPEAARTLSATLAELADRAEKS
jgi:hypothetical protein